MCSKVSFSVCVWMVFLVVGSFTKLRSQSVIPQKNNYLLVIHSDSLNAVRHEQALQISVDSLKKIGQECLQSQKKDEAFDHFQKALILQKTSQNPAPQIALYHLLAKIKTQNREFEQALAYTQKAHSIRSYLDSLAIQESKKAYKDLEKMKIPLKDQSQQWIWFLSFSFALAFILGVGFTFFFYKIFRRSQKMNEDLSKTVHKQTENLLDVIHKLEEANKDLDTFLYKASHDLKGPLTTLDGLCNIGLMEIENESAREYLQMQKKVIHSLQLLLFRIVEIGNIRHHENQARPINIKKLCRQITKSMHRAEGFSNVSFVVNILEDITANTDIDMLEIALDNVLRNALQHANYQKHRPGEVELRASANKEHLIIEVEDNGQGVLPKIQSKIFDMFFRGTDFFKGFGLGLYKAKIAMHKIGGDISLKHSEPGKTVFVIKIPKEMELRKESSPNTQKSIITAHL